MSLDNNFSKVAIIKTLLSFTHYPIFLLKVTTYLHHNISIQGRSTIYHSFDHRKSTHSFHIFAFLLYMFYWDSFYFFMSSIKLAFQFGLLFFNLIFFSQFGFCFYFFDLELHCVSIIWWSFHFNLWVQTCLQIPQV